MVQAAKKFLGKRQAQGARRDRTDRCACLALDAAVANLVGSYGPLGEGGPAPEDADLQPIQGNAAKYCGSG